MTYSKPGRASRVVALVVVIAVGLATFASAGQAATKYKNCSLAGHYRSLGPTYAELLGVSNVSCSGGMKLIKDYNTCRLHHGGTKGTCTVAVDGFKCKEKRTNSPLEFVGQVTCTKSREAATFDYTEAT